MLARRTQLITAVFLLFAAAVIARTASWVFFPGKDIPTSSAAALPAGNPSRGRIVDRDGLLLASDRFQQEVYLSPARIRSDGAGEKLASELAPILGMSEQVILDGCGGDDSAIKLTTEADAAQCDAVRDLGRPSLAWCDTVRLRTYPHGRLAAHVVGFSNLAQQGVYGVEASYDRWLRSNAEWGFDRLPGVAQSLPEEWQLYLPSLHGRDLVLNIDAPLQHLVEQKLAASIAENDAEAGTVIIMDPRTGSIYALANWPGFDLNNYSAVPSDIWVNTATGTIYEPGSVFKLVTMAAALDNGTVTADTVMIDEGSLQVADQYIYNAEQMVYGEVTVRQALAKSINVVTAKIALELGTETFYRYVRLFGFGRLTEIDINLEGAGIVKEPGNQNWSPFELAFNSFGQGISVTTIQMANAVSAIANGGALLQPQVARAMVSDGQVHYLPVRVLGYPIRAETAAELTRMMVYTVDQSSYPDLVPGYRVAGKTGTAEIPTEGGYTSDETITSFAGFLPAADPQVVILVKLVRARAGLWAEQTAVPLFGEVAQDAVRLLDIRPDDRYP
jgi:cell division protein FtsI/penicillin-binding protein 2